MKGFVIGMVLAVVILAAGFVVPRFLQPAQIASTRDALQQAELARRQLYAYDHGLPLVAAQANIEQVKSSDSPPAAVGRFERTLRDNQSLLASAVQNSSGASRTDRNAAGVGQIAGTAKMTEASGALAEARELRTRLSAEQARAIAQAQKYAVTRSERDQQAALNVGGVRETLEEDLAEIEANLGDAAEQVEDLTGTVRGREAELEQIAAKLEEVRAERVRLEQTGFTAGDDGSFAEFRDKFQRVSAELGELEAREHLLMHGGESDGTTLNGVDELRRRLGRATEKRNRFERARDALKAQDTLVASAGVEAGKFAQRYSGQLETIKGELDASVTRLAELLAQCSEKDDAALGAARAAVTAYASAKSAADNWTRAARDLQQQKDPQRQNRRLAMIIGDSVAGDFASSAQASAKLLSGRILAERAAGLSAYLDTIARINKLVDGSEIDAGTAAEDVEKARQDATEVLNEARELYERLAQKQDKTSWIHQSSLATTYLLLEQVDEFNAQQHHSNALEQINKAVQNRENSPYLAKQVMLHTQLGAGDFVPANAPEEAPEDAPDEEAAPADDDGDSP